MQRKTISNREGSVGKSGPCFLSFRTAQCLFVDNRVLFPTDCPFAPSRDRALAKHSCPLSPPITLPVYDPAFYDPTALVNPITTINLLAGKVTAWQQSKEKAEVSIVEECFYLTLS